MKLIYYDALSAIQKICNIPDVLTTASLETWVNKQHTCWAKLTLKVTHFHNPPFISVMDNFLSKRNWLFWDHGILCN